MDKPELDTQQLVALFNRVVSVSPKFYEKGIELPDDIDAVLTKQLKSIRINSSTENNLKIYNKVRFSSICNLKSTSGFYKAIKSLKLPEH